MKTVKGSKWVWIAAALSSALLIVWPASANQLAGHDSPYLAMHGGTPVRRDSLSGLFWPAEPEDVARQNLRQALSQLRKAIQDSWPKPKMLVLNFPGNPTTQCVELEFFEEVVAIALGKTATGARDARALRRRAPDRPARHLGRRCGLGRRRRQRRGRRR